MITDRIGRQEVKTTIFKEIYLHVKGEKQVISKEGSSTKGVI